MWGYSGFRWVFFSWVSCGVLVFSWGNWIQEIYFRSHCDWGRYQAGCFRFQIFVAHQFTLSPGWLRAIYYRNLGCWEDRRTWLRYQFFVFLEKRIEIQLRSCLGLLPHRTQGPLRTLWGSPFHALSILTQHLILATLYLETSLSGNYCPPLRVFLFSIFPLMISKTWTSGLNAFYQSQQLTSPPGVGDFPD